MRIIRLQAEGFMRLVAVDISPEGNLIEIRGKNEAGKSSLLGAIFAALAGASAAPVKPVREGEEFAIIRTTLGETEPEIIVTRYFDKDGTTSLKVENAEGAVYGKAQTLLDALVGAIAFDPLEFARMPAADQTAMLRRLITIDVDLDDLAAKNRADYASRRDVNRDAAGLKARIEAIRLDPDLPEVRPDPSALVDKLTAAAGTNAAIEREKDRRSNRADEAEATRALANMLRNEAGDLEKRIEELTAQVVRKKNEAGERDAEAAAIVAEVEALPPVDEPVDTAALRTEIAEANALVERFETSDRRKALVAEFEALKARSEALTATMTGRDEERDKALAAAKMPVKGLALTPIDDALVVTLDGVPFSQVSTGQQIKASTRLAMAANPRLKVLRIKEGSLLDEDNLKLLAEMAKEADYQIWAEFVGERDGVGIVIEAGKVKGAPEPERVEPPKRRKKGEAEGEDGQDDKPTKAAPRVGQTNSSIAAEPKAADPAKPRPKAMGEMRTKPAGELDL